MARLTRLAPALALVGLIVLAWQLYADSGRLAQDVLPSPSRVLDQGWQNRGDLWDNTLPTLRATLIGFAFSLVVGFALSVAIDFSTIVRRAFMPLLIVSQTLPIIAIAPLVVIWFGFGLAPKILLVALVTFFAITVSFTEGYRAAEPEAERLLRSMGASRWRVFRSVRLPTSLPYFFAGLRISITYAVVGAIFAEYAGAESGLGIYMQTAKNSFRTDLVLAAVGVSALLTLTLFALTYVVERIALPGRAHDGRRDPHPEAPAQRPDEVVRRAGGPARHQPPRPRGRVRLDPRPERQRQVDDLLDPDRRRAGRRGRDQRRRRRLPAARAGAFAYMPQKDVLLPWRRIVDNLTLGLEVQGVKRAQARARVEPLLETFGLSGFERSWPSQLSGGMRQRAALLRTVVQERPILLLDEPFGALDALTRTQMQRWLEEVWERYRWTVVLITHDVREAVFLSDRVYVLSQRPASVATEVAVPLPRPRTLETIADPLAARIEAQLLEALLG